MVPIKLKLYFLLLFSIHLDEVFSDSVEPQVIFTTLVKVEADTDFNATNVNYELRLHELNLETKKTTVNATWQLPCEIRKPVRLIYQDSDLHISYIKVSDYTNGIESVSRTNPSFESGTSSQITITFEEFRTIERRKTVPDSDLLAYTISIHVKAFTFTDQPDTIQIQLSGTNNQTTNHTIVRPDHCRNSTEFFRGSIQVEVIGFSDAVDVGLLTSVMITYWKDDTQINKDYDCQHIVMQIEDFGEEQLLRCPGFLSPITTTTTTTTAVACVLLLTIIIFTFVLITLIQVKCKFGRRMKSKAAAASDVNLEGVKTMEEMSDDNQPKKNLPNTTNNPTTNDQMADSQTKVDIKPTVAKEPSSSSSNKENWT